jgi:hypothetical protein
MLPRGGLQAAVPTEGGEIVTRTALLGVVAAAAFAIVPMALAQSPADAHQRQQTFSTMPADLHDRIGSTVTRTAETVVVDAHDRGSLPLSTPVALAEPGGFDWGDAIIGAGGGMGIALLLAGLGFLAFGQRTRTRPVTR